MISKSTPEIEEIVCEESLETALKQSYKKEVRHPSNSALKFIFGYAASYESCASALLGQFGVMNN